MQESEGKPMKKGSVSLMPVYGMAYFNFASITLLYPVIPPFAASFGATVAEVGLAVALQSYIAAVAQAPVGMLSDRLGRRNLLMAGILIFILSYLAYFFVSSFEILMVIRAFNGLGNAAFYPAASALVVDIAPEEKRGEALGLFTTATQLGSMTGPVLGGFLLQHSTYHMTFLASVIISVGALLLAFTRVSYLSRGGGALSREKLSIKWLWDRDAIISLIATLLVMAGLASVISFLPLYGPQIQISLAGVGLIMASIYVGSLFTRFQAGRLSDRMGRMPVLLAGMSLCALGAFPFFFVATPIPMHLAAFVLGVGVGATLPACSALIADRAPLRMRGFAMGLNSGSFNAGLALGATGLGIIAERVGFPSMYLVISLIVGVSTLMIFLMTRKSGRPA